MNHNSLVKLPAGLAHFDVEPASRPRSGRGVGEGAAGEVGGASAGEVGGASAGEVGGASTYLLGIDGGATKTLAAVLDVERGQLHLGYGGPSNQDAVGVQAAGEALFGAADQALSSAGISDAQLDAAVLAVAGTDTEAVVAHVRHARSREWIVVGDVVGAWATATGARPGVGAIAGTGSNVFGVGHNGRPWRAGGWGHQLGDEGSGYWLGLQSIKAALRDRERSGPETALSEAVVDHFGVDSVEALASLVYSKPLTKGEIAALAIDTGRLADAGDAVARELYVRGARLLAQQIAAVIRQTNLEGEFPVGLIGSAFKAGAVFVDPLTEAIHAHAPEARVAVVELPPVAGSLLLAARARGAEAAVGELDLAALIERAPAAAG
ncbi:MAG TPA: BadF/BadG/BcrA/BcrD ATPase family protein [Solirubrobacteraceae bacterium]|nr:BadF/BadG/BcrA/BcrD ATPase family protein [Solirubrobacteraceae bacterium]